MKRRPLGRSTPSYATTAAVPSCVAATEPDTPDPTRRPGVSVSAGTSPTSVRKVTAKDAPPLAAGVRVTDTSPMVGSASSATSTSAAVAPTSMAPVSADTDDDAWWMSVKSPPHGGAPVARVSTRAAPVAASADSSTTTEGTSPSAGSKASS